MGLSKVQAVHDQVELVVFRGTSTGNALFGDTSMRLRFCVMSYNSSRFDWRSGCLEAFVLEYSGTAMGCYDATVWYASSIMVNAIFVNGLRETILARSSRVGVLCRIELLVTNETL
jgi:hypothetical protein